jgi:hypothetical protein
MGCAPLLFTVHARAGVLGVLTPGHFRPPMGCAPLLFTVRRHRADRMRCSVDSPQTVSR